MVISLDMIDMHVISDCARMIFSEITWHMADMNVMTTVPQGTDLTKKHRKRCIPSLICVKI